jgi:RNA polymerase sigma-70 factor (ECF subfamily)
MRIMSKNPDSENFQGEEFMNGIANLVLQAKTGDKVAAENLFAQFRGYLLLIANQEVGQDLQGKFGASDFVQETMLIAYRMFPQFRGETVEELKGWLRQILRNDLHRVRTKFSKSRKREIGRELAWDDSEAFANPVDQQLTPQSNALVNEEARMLESAMAQLPENYRTAIRLREWEELSYPEIGRKMGTTEEAARKLCVRAMAKLEAALKQVMDQSQTAVLHADEQRP